MTLNFIRATGLALVFGGISEVFFPFVTVDESMYPIYGIGRVLATALLLFGLFGLHMLQAGQGGRLGLIAIIAVTLGSIMMGVLQVVLTFFPRSTPSLPIVVGATGLFALGIILLGISINRAAIFTRYSGTAMIITGLWSLFGGSRLFLGIILAGLGIRLLREKVKSIKPV